MPNDANAAIKEAMDAAMADVDFQDILKIKMEDAFSRAIEDVMRARETRDVLDDKVKKMLTPAIERVSLDQYTVKMEALLNEIVMSSALPDASRMARRLKTIFTEPVETKNITASELFDKYANCVAENVDTSDLEVEFDDEPYYADVDCHMRIDIESKPRGFASRSEHGVIYLWCNADETLSLELPIIRWKTDPDGEWTFTRNRDMRLSSLSYMSAFEAYLLALGNARAKLTLDIDETNVSVTPETKPEPDWS